MFCRREVQVVTKRCDREGCEIKSLSILTEREREDRTTSVFFFSKLFSSQLFLLLFLLLSHPFVLPFFLQFSVLGRAAAQN